MGYVDEYNERHGKCEYCKYHSVTGSHRCVECYGRSFEDNVDLFSFIKARVTKEASDKFNTTPEGKQLYEMMEQHRQTYNQCKESYNRELNKFIEFEIKRVESIINSI